MGVEIRTPAIIIGVGGAGTRLAMQARTKLNVRCLLISNDRRDLNNSDCDSIIVDVKNLLNPSSKSIRGAVLGMRNEIAGKIQGCLTVIIIGNLAGRGGTGIAPLLARMAKQEGKNVISFVIMPFKFETNKLFSAGVSLRRMREYSNCLVIVDNDALLHNNPDLSVEDCYRITNNALLEVIGSLTSGISLGEETNLLCTGKDSVSDVESALKDSFKMLYSDVADPGDVRRAMLYVMGGDKVPVGTLYSLVSSVHNILGKDGTEVGLSLSSGSQGLRVLLMASVLEKTRFDSYDPLNIIPRESVMDWDEIECDLKLESSLPRID
ncbi:MAG: hypothetical protein QXU32_07510 [Nitrososphaerales archaeon]